jgi:hypothetical protein
VDNVAAHYYIDRAIKSGSGGGGSGAAAMAAAAAAVGDVGGAGGSSSIQGVALTLGKVHSAMVVGLRNLQHALRVPIIATKHVFSTAYVQGKNDFFSRSIGFFGFFFEIFLKRKGFFSAVGGYGSSGSDTAWAYRDVMLKPWQEFVTHRLVLKKGGGGGGGAPTSHVAKWIKPEIPVDDRFRVGNAGIIA